VPRRALVRRGNGTIVMAILHRAWTFDAPAAAGEVIALFEAGGLERLRAAARAIARRAAPATAAALEELRFDPEWLEPPDESSDRAVESAVILLASHLSRAPSIVLQPGGHVVLQHALRTLAWPPHDIDLLLRGMPLDTVFAASHRRALRETVAGIRQYGGWIPRTDASPMLPRLDEAARLSGSRDAAVRTVFDQARAMLDASRRNNADLFVLLD